jgi:diaminopimelate decarboxylase
LSVADRTGVDVEQLIGLFPPGAALQESGELIVAGCSLRELALEFGTPVYVVDETALRARARRLREALGSRWPNSRVVFASKAFPCTAILEIMAQEEIGADVAGAGELVVALAAGMPPERIVMHGNAKTSAELQMAVEHGVGTIVIDNHDDIDRLERIVTSSQHVLIRVLPGVETETHESMATGQHGSKFGLPFDQARIAIDRLAASDKLVLDGLHVHIGSQILATAPFGQAVQAVSELGEFPVYDLGGGLGERYTYSEHPPTPEDWAQTLTDAARRHLPTGAQLIIEPGRSMVASSGLTLYTVVSVKHGTPTFVAVDGGMADNMDVATTGQRYEAAIVDRVGGGELVELVGRQCESGDRIVSGVALNRPRPDDVIGVPVTGAYSYTLANNYNGALRAPVVLCKDGDARMVVRRETYPELMSRDVRPG